MGYGELIIRSYDALNDRARLEDFERICEVGPANRVFLFTDTLGDPICRIRNSPIFKMLVAEVDSQLVGVIQGSIKLVTLHRPPNDLTMVGYILGLRVSPLYRRRGIGSSLVIKLEEWFNANDVDYAYMATEKENKASFKLFVDRLDYVKFQTLTILVNPVSRRRMHRISSYVEIAKLKIEEAESMYRKSMSSTQFFPIDIGNILRNKVSLGTWVAYPRGESWGGSGSSSWAMLSVWNSGELFKLRLGNAPLSCLMFTKSSRFVEKLLPCFNLQGLPDFYHPFGFYFIYGVYHEGPLSGKLVRTLCRFVHNMASSKSKDCKAIVTEIGCNDASRVHIPHWKCLSCPEDLWCIKALKNDEKNSLDELTNIIPQTRALFVDPREV